MNFQQSESTSDSVDLTGRQLGDYKLLRRLGRGGMANVYLAKQNSLNRNVALKILKPELAKDDSYVQRFRREAQAAANLIQANIVQIYEVGHIDDFYFIAQEYVQGRNLRQYLMRHGAVEPVMAINVIRQCAMALQKAGEQSVIHRDIKPENIMLSTKGEVKIADFGLARVNNVNDPALTQIGITMGTPLYMSPEQVDGSAIDHRSDLYSLGVTAYHMLAGNPPFDGDNALAIAVQHVKDTPIAIGNLRPDVPRELCQIIERLMAKKPSDRPADAKSLLKELRKIKVDLDDDWELIVEKLSAAETVAMDNSATWSQSKLAATRQLQTVMKGNLRSWWRSPGVLLSLAAISLAAVLGGWAIASQTAPPQLLNVDSISLNDVPKMATAEDQYQEARNSRYAFNPDVEEKYWLAVEKYFPPESVVGEENRTREIVRDSKARLSEFYLTNLRFADALMIFDEFVGYEELAVDFRVTGHAGQAVVFDSMKPEDFEGGEEEQVASIKTAIGAVGSQANRLNNFMLKRFNEVKMRLDALEEQGGSDNRENEPLELNDSLNFFQFPKLSVA
jgi:serine/threonine-protein kinase